MKNKGTKQKSKKKGNENAFGCDLIEHLEASGQDVPQVLQKCAEFIEEHGIVDGIYRLSGVTSNIQRLRQEFSSEACPDLTKEVYLQDIHCVGSLCKLYFRELPNPLLTYELYAKFTETVSVCGDHERLLHIQRVIKELPRPHFRTLEFLTKHLVHLANLSTKTNMHTRNLALVWAPNLLRSKTIESSAGNGDMAFQEVRIQQSVVEFILNHTAQIFDDSALVKTKDSPHLMCGEKYATLPISGQCGPMKLMSLEEAQARSLSPNHPVHKERQRENSLPDTSKAALYHTVIDLSENKRKLNGKSRKWKSIFNLGRSVDSKGKLSRNGSVFIRTGASEKKALRPSRSMESLSSLTTDDGQSGNNSPANSSNSIQNMKSRTLGSDSLHNLSENDQKWDFKGKKSGGATGGWGSINQKSSPGASGAPQKTLPEQLKVFKGDDLRGSQPTSPKNRRMLYSGSSQSSSSRPSFPGSFFPLESSPRHQRRAVNISEPFAVSVPLRVSAVISTNSTPCRNIAKDKAASLKPFKETSEPSSSSGKSNTFPQLESKKQEGTEKKDTEELVDRVPAEADTRLVQEDEKGINKTEADKLANVTEDSTTAPSAEEQWRNQLSVLQQSDASSSGEDLWSDLSQELKIIEPEIDQLDKTFKPVFSSKITCSSMKLTMDVKSKRSRSSPSLTLLCREKSTNSQIMDHVVVESSKKQPSEPDVMFHKSLEELVAGNKESFFLKSDDKEKRSLISAPPLRKFNSIECKIRSVPLREIDPGEGKNVPTPGGGFTAADDRHTKSDKSEISKGEKNTEVGKKNMLPELELIQRLSVCLEERPNTLHIHDDDDEGHHEELDLVESWEELSSNKQWVTSPLHSPDVEELLSKLSPFLDRGLQSDEGNMSSSLPNAKHPFSKSTDPYPGQVPQPPCTKPDTKRTGLPTVPMRVSSNSAQASLAKCSVKQKSAQRFYRQMSYEAASEKKEEHHCSKNRPYSLNLDLSQRCIRDISNQQNRTSSEVLTAQKGSLASTGTVCNGLTSDLEFFQNDGLALQRRNSAPVSVSSVRTAFMIKTCQAKAVPVVPPKVQYSQIPHSRQEKDVAPVKQQEKEQPKISSDKNNIAPTLVMSDLKEEIENKEPVPKHQTAVESVRTAPSPEVPVITRRHAPSLEVFVDGSRPNKANLLQRPSFRNRQRPQSLILLSPPFPIMDYHTSGDDSKIRSSMKSLNEASAANVLSKEMSENLRTSEGLQNKMTIPKSGQRLETSTSCFYQPQRRSMIFDSRSHRQIE